MNGARKYNNLFKTGQYGSFYITSGQHARGKTFHIYVLPKGEIAKSNGPCNPPIHDSAVEVYGVISGNPGWTECYGWLHKGPWEDDFYHMVALAEDKDRGVDTANEELKAKCKEKEQLRTLNLLENYEQ